MGKLLSTALISSLAAGVFGMVGANVLHASELIAIGTGGVTGVYYPTGGAICRLVNKNRAKHGLRCAVESTDGSSHNVDAIRAGELDMGIAQSDVQAAAYNGSEGFAGKKPFKELRSIFSVYAEPMHFLTRADAGINTFMDVKGKRVNIGNAGSGHRQTVALILAHLGWNRSVFSLAAELRSAEQSQALCENRIDAVFFTVGVPNGSIKEAARTCNTKIIPLSGDWVDAFLRKFPAYTKAIIPGGIYRGTDNDVATIESRATLLSSTKAGDDTVYKVVKAVFENLETFKNMHPAFANLNKQEMIVNGLTAPLHEGAARYYKEIGLM